MKAAIGCFIGLVFGISSSAEPLLEGQVRLESGEPVADAQVRIFDLSDLRQGAIARAMTDGTGYFALPLTALGGRALPERFALGPNYPNPFNPSTIIPYQLAASSQVRLEVFNLLGQHLATLVDGARAAGFHTATWHATDAAGRAVGAGVYIYRMTVGVESQTGRMVLLDGQAGLAAGGTASVMPGASGVGGSDGEGAQVYGLVVSGSGLVPYVDSSFRVESGMAPVELVVSSGSYSAGKAVDFDDFFDFFNNQQEEEEDETEEEEEETDTTASEGGPDLIVQSPSVSDNILTPGQAFTLNVTVHNQGDEQAAATMLHYYRSNNATITSSDTEVGTDAIDALDASATSAASIALTAPTDVSAGRGIYYGACVDSVSGESSTDNNCSSAVKITVSGQVATEEEATEEEEAEEATEEEEEDDTPVTIPDANLRAAIEAALDKARGAPITLAEMKTLDHLRLEGADINDLAGLESATNLTSLDLWNIPITDLSALAGLTNLRSLNIFRTNISDLSALSGLTNLTWLFLRSNNITDLSALAGLTNLTGLFLRDNNITDLSALSGLTSLRSLELWGTSTSDLSALAGLTNLTWLDLFGTNTSDLSALSGLTNLTWLDLSITNISDLSALAGLANLTWLDLSGTNISDLSALSGLTNLTWLDLSITNTSDLSALAGLTNLTELDLFLTNISDLSALSGLTDLERLYLSETNTSDLSALSGLTNLTELALWETPLSVSSINDHIPALQGRGITVLFDPTPLREREFNIELVFLTDQFNEARKNVIRFAARRWMSVITEDLPDYTFTQGFSGQCGDHSYAIPSGERIDDLRIYVTSIPRDEYFGAWGRPHLLREETHLSVLGCMGFQLRFAISLISGLHEIGHVVGFGGPVWEQSGFRQDLSWDDPNADTHFNGPLAIAAFDDAGGRNYTGAKVPVQKMDGSHWRSSVFGSHEPESRSELMTPGGGRALSAITVQSMADLGYSVDISQASPYTLPNPAAKASAKIAASKPSILGVDVTQADAYTWPGADLHWQESIVGGLPLLPGGDRFNGRLESAEWVGDRGFDLRSRRAVPALSCGADLRREPIYVIDPQGRIIRTISH